MTTKLTHAMLHWREDLPHEPSLAAMKGLAAVDSTERAEFLLSAPELPWVYLHTCPTPEIAMAAVEAVPDIPDGPSWERPPVEIVFARLGVVAVEALDSKLAESPTPHPLWHTLRAFVAEWLARPRRDLRACALARRSRLDELPTIVVDRIETAWNVLQDHPTGDLHRLHHEPIRAMFGTPPRFLGDRELAVLHSQCPDRSAELSALGGMPARDFDDDPLGLTTQSAFDVLTPPDKRRAGLDPTLTLAPDRVFAYPHHSDRWPGFGPEGRLYIGLLGNLGAAWSELRPRSDLFHRIVDACGRMLREADEDVDIYREAGELELVWEDSDMTDPALALAHAAFCVFDWLTQRGNRTDQDNITDILYFTWARQQDRVGPDERREYWERWLLEELPRAYLPSREARR